MNHSGSNTHHTHDTSHQPKDRGTSGKELADQIKNTAKGKGLKATFRWNDKKDRMDITCTEKSPRTLIRKAFESTSSKDVIAQNNGWAARLEANVLGHLYIKFAPIVHQTGAQKLADQIRDAAKKAGIQADFQLDNSHEKLDIHYKNKIQDEGMQNLFKSQSFWNSHHKAHLLRDEHDRLWIQIVPSTASS